MAFALLQSDPSTGALSLLVDRAFDTRDEAVSYLRTEPPADDQETFLVDLGMSAPVVIVPVEAAAEPPAVSGEETEVSAGETSPSTVTEPATPAPPIAGAWEAPAEEAVEATPEEPEEVDSQEPEEVASQEPAEESLEEPEASTPTEQSDLLAALQDATVGMLREESREESFEEVADVEEVVEPEVVGPEVVEPEVVGTTASEGVPAGEGAPGKEGVSAWPWDVAPSAEQEFRPVIMGEYAGDEDTPPTEGAYADAEAQPDEGQPVDEVREPRGALPTHTALGRATEPVPGSEPEDVEPSPGETAPPPRTEPPPGASELSDEEAPAAAFTEPPKAYEPGEMDIDSYTCEDCVYVETCPKRGEMTPSSCGSFQWRAS